MINKKNSSFKKTWYIVLPFLVYFLVHDMAQVALALLLSKSLTAFGEGYRNFVESNASSVNGVLNALALLIGMAAVLPMARKELRMSREDSGCKIEKGSHHKSDKSDAAGTGKKLSGYLTVQYLLLILFAASLAMGCNILLTLLGVTGVSAAYQEVAVRQYGVNFGIGILVYGILSPLAEETVFRGLIYNRMKRDFQTPLAIVVCGILFGLYHGNLVQGVYGCILGIAITFSYELYGSFLAPVLFHSAANISVFAAGYNSSVMNAIVTPVNCVLFLAVSAASLILILKMPKNISDKNKK